MMKSTISREEQEIIPVKEELEDAIVIEKNSENNKYQHDSEEMNDELAADQYCAIPDDPIIENDDDIAAKAKIGENEDVTEEQREKLRNILRKYNPILLHSGNALPECANNVECDLNPKGRPIKMKPRRVQAIYTDKLFLLLKGLLETGIIQFSLSEWSSPIVIVLKKNGEDIRMCIDYVELNKRIELMMYTIPRIEDLLVLGEHLKWLVSLDMASGATYVHNVSEKSTRRNISKEEEQEVAKNLSRMPKKAYIDDLTYGGTSWDDMCERTDWLFGNLFRANISVSILKSVFGVTSLEHLSHRITAEGRAPAMKDYKSWIKREFPKNNKQMLSFLGSVIYYKSYVQRFPGLAAILYQLKDEDFKRDLTLERKAFEMLKMDLNELPMLYHPQIQEDFYVYVYANEWSVAATVYQMRTNNEGSDKDAIKNVHVICHTGRVLKKEEIPYQHVEKEILALLHVFKDKFYLLYGKSIHVKSTGSTMRWLLNNKELKGRQLHWQCQLAVWNFDVEKVDLKEFGQTYNVANQFLTADQLDKDLNQFESVVKKRQIVKAITAPENLVWSTVKYVLSFDGSANSRNGTAGYAFALWEYPEWKLVQLYGSNCDLGTTVNGAEYMGMTKGVEYAIDQGIEDLLVLGDSDLVISQLQGLKTVKTESLLPFYNAARKICDQLSFIQLYHIPRKYNTTADLIAGEARKLDRIIDYRDRELSEKAFKKNMLPEWEAETNRPKEANNEGVNSKLISAVTTRSKRRATRKENQEKISIEEELKDLENLNNQPQPINKFKKNNNELRTKKNNDKRTDGIQQTYQEEESPVNDNEIVSQNEIRGKSNKKPEERKTHETIIENEIQEISVQEENQPIPTVENDIPVKAKDRESQQLVRLLRIGKQQDQVPWMKEMKEFLNGISEGLTRADYKRLANKINLFAVDQHDILYQQYVVKAIRGEELELKLVIPDVLREEFIHSMHDERSSGHLGTIKTFNKLKKKFYWPGMFKDVERYVLSCLDCQTGKGKPRNKARSKGNLIATFPMEVIGMDILGPFPTTDRGSAYVIVFVCLFTGFTMTAVMKNKETTAIDCALKYEEAVYNRFGACKILRHDRDPRFMSEFFQNFNASIGQKQRATLSYRPQANGTSERSIQSITRILKMFCLDPMQKDWDVKLNMVTFALNTAYNESRKETPFYLMHGFDPLTPLEAMTIQYTMGGTKKDGVQWRRTKQEAWQKVRLWVVERLQKLQENRIAKSEKLAKGKPYEVGDSVWIYIPKVKEGFNRKLAHLWHGPFRIVEKYGDQDQVYKIDIGSFAKRNIFSKVHYDRLKKCYSRNCRPKHKLKDTSSKQFDFDEAMLPEDSWAPDEKEYGEVEEIIKHRRKILRSGQHKIEYLIKWMSTKEQEWIRAEDLNCGYLLQNYWENNKADSRREALQLSIADLL